MNARMVWLSVAVSLAVVFPAAAQTCEFNLCSSGRTYLGGGTDWYGAWGSCGSCNWLGYCSHEIVRCPAGSTFDLPSGQCTWNLCSGCGGELPLCEAPSRFTSSGVDVRGPYAVCTRGGETWGAPIAHSVERCAEGWTLQPGSGNCRRNCLPDLTIRRTFLRNSSGAAVKAVSPYQRYFICAEVVNLGLAWAGASQLRGGGLGVSVNPTATIPALGPSAWTTVCLSYPTTPSPGTYRVGVTADAVLSVTESLESNNDALVTVPVLP